MTMCPPGESHHVPTAFSETIPIAARSESYRNQLTALPCLHVQYTATPACNALSSGDGRILRCASRGSGFMAALPTDSRS